MVYTEFTEVFPDNYKNTKGKTVAQLKEAFAKALKEVNIDFNDFEEDQIYRLTSCSYTTSAYYLYETYAIRGRTKYSKPENGRGFKHKS